MCDNCRNPRETIDATNSLSTALKTIELTDGKVDLKHIIQYTVGQGYSRSKSI